MDLNNPEDLKKLVHATALQTCSYSGPIEQELCEGGRKIVLEYYAQCKKEMMERSKYEELEEENAQLKAKVERLMSRGIEDMKYEIATLQSDLEEKKLLITLHHEAGMIAKMGVGKQCPACKKHAALLEGKEP